MKKKLLLLILSFVLLFTAGCDNGQTGQQVGVDDDVVVNGDEEGNENNDDSQSDENDENNENGDEEDITGDNPPIDDVFNDQTGEDAGEEEVEGVFANIYTYEIMDAVMYARTEVNVRTLPSTKGEILGRLQINDSVHIIGRCIENGWYKVEYKDTIAFVHHDYLVDSKVTVTPPTTSTETNE